MTPLNLSHPWAVPTPPEDPSMWDPEEHYSRQQIQDLQYERLRWTLHHAYNNVPAYRQLYDDHGVHPNDFTSLNDITLFPYIDKAFLRASYPLKALAVPMKDIRRIHASSGTTGQPTVVAYTANDLKMWASLVARSFRASGVQPGHVIHNAYGYGLFTGGLGAHNGAEWLGCPIIPMSGGQTEKQIRMITDLKPDVILCTPTYLLALADGFVKAGIDPKDTSLKYGVLGAEPWTEGMREEIESLFDMKACDIYGLSELLGPGMGGEAVETQDGCHLWEDHFYPEIIDPISTEVLPDGQSGELVFSSLTREALPILRFRTHDLTTLRPGTARAGHRRMDRILGRSDDMIILRGVNLFPSQIEELALEIDALSPHFLLEITRPNRMDELTIKIERRATASLAEAEAGGQVLRARIKDRIGCSCNIDVVEPDTLARSSGKLRRIYDLRAL
ncbi:phenylacetate--CoA ligase family protein [Enteractinococcus coprophilus]|uniref:Phenylacetate-coenzyme A ligase n=1 Tax=Enteractinococcus coprophilus TaxID=1027633 RepID=A0A543AN41_9MICC|nr:AMP-binding protein [Enteractinococcus coprophilus]TQL74000.1 phenylacetate-CoA ligase [Enteractinococcus coprophilus]